MSIAAYPRIADWIGARDGRLVVHSGKVDIGQRITTALVQIAHEELTVPLAQIDIAPVRTSDAPDEGMTSGSNSLEQSGRAVRCAAATLRARLCELAAGRLGGAADEWQLEDGALHLPGSNHRIEILELIGELHEDVPLDPAAAPVARTPGAAPRPDMRHLGDMVSGRFVYVQDLDPPGMLHARVIRPPHAHARLSAVAAGAVEREEGRGMRVVRDGSFLAVAGAEEWPVLRAAARLAAACAWDDGGGLPETDVFGRLAPENARRFPVTDGQPHEGPVPGPLAGPAHSARFERPYQLHAALAPSAAMALWDGERLEVQSHSQGIYPLRESIADSLGLDPGQVDIAHVPGSGCYGHNGADDAAFEAALVAMALPGAPILLKWTREEEHAWEPCAPAMAVEVAARLRGDRIAAYSAEAFSDTHRGRPRPGANRAGPARLLANRFRAEPIDPVPAQPNMGRHAGIHRNLDPIYAIPEKRLVKNLVSGLPLRSSALRCLGAAANVFALESFIDEIALRQGVDPLRFRRAHMTDARGRDVLDTLAQRVQALPPMPGGCGLAYAQYKNRMTRVGVAVHLEVSDRGAVRLNRAEIVADAGRVIDLGGLEAQLEGGFIQAASWALYEQVTWDRDGITSRDWDSYPVIRFDNVPEITVTVLDRPEEAPAGAGEASPGPAIAAIANAIYDATGLRMRRMPFTPEAILQQAMAE